MLASAATAADRDSALAYLNAVMPDASIAANLPDKAALLQIWKNTGKFSGVSDSDLNALSEDFLRLYTPLYVPRLRDAFVDHFVETFSDEDLEKMTACNVGGDCSPARADADLVDRARGLASFGQIAGTRIGSQVGKQITPKLIELVKENAGGRFQQREALVAGLEAGAAQ
ncbi:MAG: hypothetical protein AAF141_06655 [Pseudomonadota bacterium]